MKPHQTVLCVTLLPLQHFSPNIHHLPHELGVLASAQVLDVGQVLLGDYQEMVRSVGPNVPEASEVTVIVKQFCVSIPAYDPTEGAVLGSGRWLLRSASCHYLCTTMDRGQWYS